MGFDNHHEGFGAYAAHLIKFKARQLVGRVGFTESDREDLEQEMTEDLLRRLPKFDPRKASLHTFVARIVDHKIANLIRYQRQEKRDHRRRAFSLDEFIDDGEGHSISRVETISQDEHDLRAGKYTGPASEREDMRVDVWSVISELPPDLQAVAKLLMTHSITETARELGLHRDTIHRDRMVRLREFFEDGGLRGYL